MKTRIFNIYVIISLVISLFVNVIPAMAEEDPFPLIDMDGDALSNTLETDGWYNLAGGPFSTDPNDRDSDDDGLTDGEEKLFDSNPLDPHNPGLTVKYENSFKTKEYFSTSDPAYLSMKQGGDQYLLTEAIVVRRGTTFTITGPANGTLSLSGTSMTAITPVRDPANGGWKVTIPPNGTVGTYTATVTDGVWTKSMPVYVIFELPANMPQAEVEAFLYNDDPSNKRDEVAVFWRMGEWPYYGNYQSTVQPCPGTDPNAPCSLWQYHLAYGYAQAYWTEQFTKSALVDHAIKAMHGKNTPALAVSALASWIDYEFRTRSSRMQNNWSSSMYRYFDGTGITMVGGYCETTSTTYTAILRSAGIASRPFALDYNKTAGHSESGQIGTVYEYDHATMIWLNDKWYAQRAYGGDEVNDVYYPWNSTPTGAYVLEEWDTRSGYYNDYYGDGVFSVNENWTYQTSDGVGTVNTVWVNGVPSTEFKAVNRDYSWDSKYPLRITQSPHVDVHNHFMWYGDNWAPGEWRTPIVSNPAGRDETLTYYLPAGVPDPATPLENWPTNPQPTACSPATPPAECAAFLASWTPDSITTTGTVSSVEEVKGTNTIFLPLINNQVSQLANIELGEILDDYGVDTDNDGYFDELIIKFNVSSSIPTEAQFGGWLSVGENSFRSSTETKKLKAGNQTVEISFDGYQIGELASNGPYILESLWAARPDQDNLVIIEPENPLDYVKFSYSTQAYQYDQFEVLAASIDHDGILHRGIDGNLNGLYEIILITVPLNININANFTLEGDLYDANGTFVGNASWTGDESTATLRFDVSKTTPPYSLEHVNLNIKNGELLDSRYASLYEINDMAGKIESGAVTLGINSVTDPTLMQPLTVNPSGSYIITPVDSDGNGKFDKLRVLVGVTVTESSGNYKIEGMLEDEYGKEIAWAVSDPQYLTIGNRTMTLEFDGKMLYDQLPLTGSRSFKLVAVKIFSGNLSSSTLESEAYYAITTPAYARSQFEPSSPAITIFQDDLENGIDNWTVAGTIWSLDSNTWNSWTNTWMATSTVNGSGQLALVSPLNFSNYAGAVLHFDNAYRLGSINDKGVLEVSIDGGSTWTAVATYTGVQTSPHWITESINLSAYAELPDVRLRFNATQASVNGLLWYVDDVTINAWPAVKTASFTYPSEVVAGVPTLFTASYTSIDTSLPMTYKWNFSGEEVITTSPSVNLTIPEFGEIPVTLTVSSLYDSAITTQTINVLPNPNQALLIVDIVPDSGGTVLRVPDQVAFDLGTQVTLTAIPNAGYVFSGWNGGDCSGIGTCTFTINENTTITAAFTPVEYDLTITLEGVGEVSRVPENDTYHYGDVVQLTAMPGPTYGFSQWKGDLTGTTNPVSITIEGDTTITAEFVQGYSLTINSLGDGAVTKYPDKSTYLPGEQVTLTPFPDLHWDFSTWSGACTGIGSCVVTMDSNKEVNATFTKAQYDLTFGINGSGTITKDPDQATYTYGQRVTLTANPEFGWKLSSWAGAITGSYNPYVLTITGDMTVIATFIHPTYAFPNVTVLPSTAAGTATKSPNATAYYLGTEVTVTATPKTGWEFDHWEGSCTGTQNPCLVTVDGAEAVTAYFKSAYSLTINTIGLGSVTREPYKETYQYGDVVTLTPVGDGGWTFDSWSGDLTGNAIPVSITMNGNKNITATFTEDHHLLDIIIDGGGHVNLVPPGLYLPELTPPSPYFTYHEMPNMFAVADPGWTFANWTGDRTGTANPMAITMSGYKTVTAHFTPTPYTISTSIVGQGSVSKNPEQSTYIYGDEVTLTATPVEGWTFSEWSGSCTGSGACVVIVDGNENVTATFIEGASTKNLILSVTGSGTVTQSPPPPYNEGAFVNLTPIPAVGWHFVEWTGDYCSGSGDCVVTLDTDKAVGVTFALNNQNLTVTQPENGLISPSSGSYPYDSMVELIASPAENFHFVSWTGACEGQSIPCHVVMDADKTVSAIFAFNTFNLSVTQPAIGGAITPETASYDFGTSVTLNAIPQENYHFVEWTGACSGQLIETCNITVNQDLAVSAIFSIDTFELTVEQTTGGTVAPKTAVYSYGQEVTLTATASTGYLFTGWNGACAGQLTTTCTILMDGPKTVSAIFTQRTFTLTMTYNPTEGGGTTIPPAGGTIYTYGTVVTVLANPEPGYKFDHWAGSCTGTGNCSVTMTTNRAVTAYFTPILHDLTIVVDPVGGGTTTPSIGVNPILEGTVVEISATPNPGYVFDHWSGACSGSSTCSVTMNIPQSVTAHFTPIFHDLTISVDPVGGGTTSPSIGLHSYLEGTVVPVTAMASTGYLFDHWGGACTGTDACQVTMNTDNSVIAYFEQYTATFILTYTAGPNGSISGDTTQIVNIGENGTTVEAIPNIGYHFVSWSDGSTANPRTDTNVTADITVTANFTINTYTLTYLAGTGGTLTGETTQTVNYGGSGTAVTALPNTGYHFVNWSDGSSQNPRTDTNVMSDVTVTANFALETFTLDVSVIGNGTVSKDPDMSNYPAGTDVVLSALPQTGWHFVEWSGDLTGSVNPETITMEANKSVTAVFEKNAVTLTINQATGGTITAEPAGPYEYGDVVTLTATANTGYTFTGWTGDLSGTTTPTTLTLNGDKTVSATFTLNAVTLTINQATGGTITAEPAGPYEYGDVVTLTATVNAGYTFTGWTGDLSGTTTPTTLTLNGDKTVSATFTLNAVTLTINQATGGTITAEPAGPYEYGDVVTLTATANAGYTFTGWTGDLSGTTTPTTLTLNGDKTVSANFTLNAVTLTINQATGGTITAEPAGPYEYGDVVTLTATANAGYTFTGWTGDLSGTTTPTTLTLNGDKTVSATFTLNAVTLTINQATGGTITAEPAGPYEYGDVVTLTATVNAGYTFTGWTGDLSGTTTPTTLTLNGDKTVSATFTLNAVTLTINQATGGTITAEPAGPYEYGDVVTLTATANAGYTFTGWTGDLSGTTTPTTLTLNGDKTVSANFTLNAVTLTINQATGGTITAEPAGPYEYGDVVTLTATVNAGYTFTGWTGDLSGTTTPTTLTLNGDKTVSATFTLNAVTLTINQATGGTITAEPAGPYEYGDVVTLTATANAGYTFTGWTGDLSGTTTPTTLTLNGDKTVSATFTLNAVTLTINQATGGTITAEPAGPYEYGDVVTLTATANAGYTFTGWTGDLSGTTTPTTLTLNGDKTVSANFTLNAVTLTINQATGGTITAEPAGPYEYGDVVTLTATANAGYTFTGWTGDLSGTTTPTTLTLNGDKTVSATFTLNAVTLTINQATGGTITAEPAGPYEYGDVVTLTATVNAGYTFTGWTGDLSGTTTPTTLTLNGDKTVSATFTLNAVTLTINQATGGTITAEPAGPYEYGDVVTLTATANAGYTFTGWTGDLSGTTTPTTLTLNGDKTVSANFTLNAVTLTINQATGGTITAEPAGPYEYGDVVTLTATVNAGYTFTGWTGDLSGTTTPTTLTLNGDKTVSATFTLNAVTLTINQATGGTITAEPAGPYEYGDVVTLTATANAGYTFTGWTGDLSGTTTPTTLTLNGDKTVSATFTLNAVTLTINQATGGTITAEPAGPYEYGDVVTLTATANAGYTFTGWTGDLSGTTTPTTLTLNGDKTVSATFTLNPVTLTINQVTGGTIMADPAGPYEYGDVVTLTVTADTGYTFTGWTGALSGTTNPTTLTLNSDKTVSAVFAINTYTLTVISEHGTVSKVPDLTNYNYGTDVLLTMSSVEPGWTFVAWSGGGCSGTAPCTVTITSDTTVTALFSQNQYFIYLPLVITGGSVVQNPDQDSYTYGTEVTLTAIAKPGWVFDSWSGDCSGTNQTCLLLMDSNKNVSATFFLADEVTLTINEGSGGTITADPAGPYLTGDEVTLTAIPDPGYTFTGWTDGLSGTANPITFTLESEMVVGATFNQDMFYIPKDLITDPGIIRENFESMDGWIVSGSGSGFYASVDTTNYKEGEAAIKMTTPATTGNVAITKTVNWDLSSPDEQGNFRFWVYVHGTAAPRDFQILMSNDASYQNFFVTYYNASYKFNNMPGWNLVNVRASDWRVGAGSPSWTEPITRVRFRIYGTSVASYTLDGLASGVTALPAVVFTFDDADASLWTQAYAYMNDKNVRGTGYVVTDWVEGTNKVTWAQLQEMDGAGWTIGNHTKALTDLSLLTLAEQEAALMDARTALSDHGITNSDYVAYPYGKYNEDTMMAMENLGMRLGRTMMVANNVSPLQSPFEISQREVVRWLALSTVQTWVNTAIARQEILVLTFHDIGTSPTSGGWYVDRFQSLVDYLISQDIPIITMDDLYQLQSGDIGSPDECYPLSVTHTGMGTNPVANPIQSEGCEMGAYKAGETITLSNAIPDTGWEIAGWSGTSNNSSTAETNMVTMPPYPHTAGVNYTQITFTLTYTAESGGSLIGETSQIVNYGSDGSTVTAIANTGYHFVNWSDGTIQNPRTDTNVMMDLSVTANFSINTYNLNYVAGVGGTLSGETTQFVNHGSDGTAVTAIPDSGYNFVNWSDGVTENPRIDTNVVADVNVTANFAFGTIVTLTINEGSGGTITADPAGPYLTGDEVTLTAIPDPGYTFTGWTDGLSGTANPITFTLESEMVVGATFNQDMFYIPKDLITDPGIIRENFESMDGWIVSGSGSGFYASVDTTNYKEGEAAIKMTTPATTGNVAITKTVNWDLSSPDEQGNFRFWVYVHGTAAPRDFQILMSNDASYQNFFVTYYNASYKFNNMPGWNLVNVRASDWRVGAGSPSWTEPITRVRFRIYGTSVASYTLDGLASGVTAMPAVVFTFDDADASLWTQAYAYMNDKNVRGTGYVVTDWVEGTNKVTWAQLQEMDGAGWTIGNHTKALTDLSLLTLAEQEAALMDARTALSDHGITNSDYVAYPYGKYNEDTMMAMENLGMRLGRTMMVANNVSPLQSPYEISQREVVRWLALSTVQTWVNTAIARQEILVLTFHDIGTSPTSGGWYVDRFQSLVDYLISQDIPIITMDDLYQLQSGGVGIPVPE